MGIVATVSLLFISGPLSGNRAVAYGGDYPSYGGYGGYGLYTVVMSITKVTY